MHLIMGCSFDSVKPVNSESFQRKKNDPSCTLSQFPSIQWTKGATDSFCEQSS